MTKEKEKDKEDPFTESKTILGNIIDRALQRDFSLSNEAGKPLYILTLKDEHNATILCQIDECSKRNHKITISKSLKRPWSSQNFYRHIRAIHFTAPVKKKKTADENEEMEETVDDLEGDNSNSDGEMRSHSTNEFSGEESVDNSSKSKTDS